MFQLCYAEQNVCLKEFTRKVLNLQNVVDLRVSRKYINSSKKKNPMFEPVPFETGVEMARKIGAVGYAETSSLTSHGVAEVFNEVMRYGVIFSLAQQQAQQKSSSHCIAM